MKRVVIVVTALSVAGLFLVGLWLWDPRTSKVDKGAVEAAASDYDVEIIRDNYGVPHIFGKVDADTIFGLGFANSEDDFQTIQEVVAATRGDLARYRGIDAAPTDYIVSLLQVWETVEAGYERDVPPHLKTIAQAYADGVNLYALQNPSEVWPGLAPFTAKDVIAGFVFKTPLFYGLDGILLELFGEEHKQEIALDPASGRQSFHLAPRTMAERGSNAFAVAPERSDDGVTRLLINSHQPLTGPVAWYEAHLVSEDGLDITGGTFPGAPLILHGFNRNLGWANTVNKPDLADVYVLTINPDDPDQYRFDGEWVEFEKRMALLRIGLAGPFALKVKRPVLFSKHGPVIQAKHGTYSVRYAGMNEVRQLEQYYRLNRATHMAEFLEVMAMNALPSINYIYADKVGNVGFIYNGQYPNRDNRWDWSKELPGDRSDLIWQEYLPFTDVPIIINPQSGLVWNSNNTPLVATDGPDNLVAEQFAQSMGLQTNMTNRSLRIGELTDGVTPLSREALLAIKFDTFFSNRSHAALIVEEVLAHDWGDEPKMAQAAQHLAKWNFSVDVANRQAALGTLTVLPEVTEEFTKVASPDRLTAFRNAVSLLMKNYGTVDVRWGQVNRLVRGDVNIQIDGGPDILRAIYPAEIRDDATLHASAGDSWIALVEWDKAGNQTADLIHNFGSATRDDASPHYADQAKLFANQKFRRALLDKGDIIENASERYTPLER